VLRRIEKYVDTCTRRGLFGIIITFHVLLSACEFEPEDPPLTQLDPPGDPPPIQISLNNRYDTVKIDWITTFTYEVTGENRILSVSIDFEEKEVHHYIGEYGQSLSFVLDPSSYPNGVYPLRIEVITSSGTGSLADKLDAEGYLYQLEWPVLIDKTPPGELDFVSIDSLKEGVRITWEKFNHLGFRYYKLKKSSFSLSNSIDLVTYLDPGQTSFIDTTYMEGMVVNYIIELGGKSSGINSSSTNSIQYFQLPHTPKITNIRDFKIDLSWDPPNNVHLLDYYYIHQDRTTVTIHDQYKIFEPDTRIRSESVTFGKKNYFGILYVPKPIGGNVYTNNLKRAEIEFQPGQLMPAYHYACPIRNTDNILLSNNGKIFKYNLPSGILMDSVVTNSEYPDYFTLSTDGSFFGYSENGNFITRSTDDFRILHTMSNPDFSNNIGILLRLSVSDSGRLMMILEFNTVLIFDLATGNKIAEKEFGSISWMIGAISPDGNYIITQEYRYSLSMRYYQITGDQIVNIAGIDDSGLKFYPVIPNPFGPENDIYVLYNNKVEVRNITDFSVKKTLSLSGIQYIDFSNMKAVGNSTAYIGSDLGYLYELETGTLMRELMVSGMNSMIFHSNYLISAGGRKMLLLSDN